MISGRLGPELLPLRRGLSSPLPRPARDAAAAPGSWAAGARLRGAASGSLRRAHRPGLTGPRTSGQGGCAAHRDAGLPPRHVRPSRPRKRFSLGRPRPSPPPRVADCRVLCKPAQATGCPGDRLRRRQAAQARGGLGRRPPLAWLIAVCCVSLRRRRLRRRQARRSIPLPRRRSRPCAGGGRGDDALRGLGCKC